MTYRYFLVQDHCSLAPWVVIGCCHCQQRNDFSKHCVLWSMVILECNVESCP